MDHQEALDFSDEVDEFVGRNGSPLALEPPGGDTSKPDDATETEIGAHPYDPSSGTNPAGDDVDDLQAFHKKYDKDLNAFKPESEAQNSAPQQAYVRPRPKFVPDPVPPDVMMNPDAHTRWLFDQAEKMQAHSEAWAHERELDERVLDTEKAAVRQYSEKNGLDPYMALVDNYAIPVIQKNGWLDLVRQQDDPAATAYFIGFCEKYRHLAPEVIRRIQRKGKIDASIFRSMNFQPTVQARDRDDSRLGTWASMPNDVFLRELEAFKLSDEGE